MSLALLAGAIALSVMLQRSLVDDIDQVAELRAGALARQAAQGTLETTIQADDDEVVQLVDSSGKVLASSSNVHGQPALPTLYPNADEPAKVTTDSIVGVPGSYRLLALAADTPTGPSVVYVATSLKHADASLVLQQRSLLIGVPLLLALVVMTTWVTVGRALRPVDAIRSEVAEITRLDLDRRVPVSRANDEVSRLARTMNAMLDRLQNSADRQQQFIADASHELRTPLAATRADLEVALLHPEAGSWQSTAQAVLDETLWMQRLIDDLLQTARADYPDDRRPIEPVDLRQVVLHEVQRTRASDRVRIDTSRVTYADVLGRRQDLARAVRNVIDNAQQHAHSQVTISLGSGDGSCVLEVDDDGPGIPLKHQERVFERFTRLDDARNRHSGGTGLGLAIVREIVERHHGTVEVSTGTASGACFIITLPLATTTD